MDREVVEALAKAGFDRTLEEHFATVGIHMEAPDRVIPVVEGMATVVSGERAAPVRLRRISQL